MEYGRVLSRSVNIVWQNKYLILLGILAGLGSATSGGGGGGGGSGNGGGQSFGEFEQFTEVQDAITGLAVGAVIGGICVLVLVALALWAISTIARGGLIAGVDDIESGQKSSFRQAWGAGWQKAKPLLGIGILPAVPGIFLFVAGVIVFFTYGGLFALFGEEFADVTTAGLGIGVAVFACILIPIMLVLSILRNFAERACMLEDLGVIDSYRRGASVLMSNLGEAIILFLIQIAIFVVLFFIFFVPGLILFLCCCLWPLLLVIQGAISAFVSSIWTLAWRTWTGEPPMMEKEPAAI